MSVRVCVCVCVCVLVHSFHDGMVATGWIGILTLCSEKCFAPGFYLYSNPILYKYLGSLVEVHGSMTATVGNFIAHTGF